MDQFPGQCLVWHRAPQATQPRANLADQLERITPRFDELTQRARLGYDAAELHELEELAQSIARDLVASFRGQRAASAPLYVSACGHKAAW